MSIKPTSQDTPGTEAVPQMPEEFAGIHDAVESMMDAAERAPEESDKGVRRAPPGRAVADDEDKDNEDSEADTEDDEGEEPEEDEEEDEEESGVIPRERLDETYVDAGDGTRVTVGELMKERMMRSRFTQGMQELAEQRRALEDTGASTEEFAGAVLEEFGTIAEHYKKYWNQLDGNSRQILQQLAQSVNSARQATKTWNKEFQERQLEARRIEARDNLQRLNGYVPNWTVNQYNEVIEYYTKEFGTPAERIHDILDAGLMAGLYQGMRYGKGSRKLASAKRGKIRPKRRQSAKAPLREAPARQPENRNLEQVKDLDSALDFLLSETNG